MLELTSCWNLNPVPVSEDFTPVADLNAPLNEFPRINLYRFNIVDFELRALFIWSDEAAAHLARESNSALEKENQTFGGESTYVRGGKGIRLRVAFTKRFISKDGDPRLEVVLTYRATRKATTSRRSHEMKVREDGLIRIIDLLGQPTSAFASVSYVFSKSNVQNTWFPLPFEIGDSAEDSFQIEAVVAKKLGSKDKQSFEYGFLLSSEHPEEIKLDVFFPTESSLSPKYVEERLNHVNSIAERLVVR